MSQVTCDCWICRVDQLRSLCEENMTEATDGTLTNASTIWPSEVLAIIDTWDVKHG